MHMVHSGLSFSYDVYNIPDCTYHNIVFFRLPHENFLGVTYSKSFSSAGLFNNRFPLRLTFISTLKHDMKGKTSTPLIRQILVLLLIQCTIKGLSSVRPSLQGSTSLSNTLICTQSLIPFVTSVKGTYHNISRFPHPNTETSQEVTHLDISLSWACLTIKFLQDLISLPIYDTL